MLEKKFGKGSKAKRFLADHNALQQRQDTAPVEMSMSLHSHGLRHVGVPLKLPRTRNVDKYVVIHTTESCALGCGEPAS